MLTDLSLEAAAERANEVLGELHNSPVAVELLNRVQKMLDVEDAHWSTIFGNIEHEGFTLDDLHQASDEIRKTIVKSPVIDRGAQLRHSYIWSKGINLPEVKKKEGTAGAKSIAEKAVHHPTNQRFLFSEAAYEELERGLYSDGNVFILGENATRVAHRVPVSEIVDFLTNPDFAEEVWAWKREWKHTDRLGTTVTKAAWYYTDDCPLPESKRAKKQIAKTPVDHGKTMMVQSVNRQIGWPLGIPDAVAAVAWAKLYSEFLKHGYVMSRSLASIAFRATATTRQGGENAALKLATPQGAGSTAIMGAANTLTALPTAGKGYDFDSGRPIAAMVATSVQVSIVHLLSDPGAAGSSYGSASNLDLPTKRAVVSRQRSWAAFYNRILTWMNVADPDVSFPSLEEPDFYREVQALMVGWTTGTIRAEELRPRLLKLLQIDPTETAAPDGVMLPNNRETVKANQPSDQGVGQGKSTPAGKGPNANDIRTDGIGEALQSMELTDLMRRVLERLDEVR